MSRDNSATSLTTRLARSMAEHCDKTVYEYEDFLADLVTTVEGDEQSILLARAILNKSAGRVAEAAESRKLTTKRR